MEFPAEDATVVGAVGGVFTEIVKLAQVVEVPLHGLLPTLLTK